MIFGAVYEYEGLRPSIGRDVFVAPTAVVSGDLVIGDQASIWYQAVARADVHYIRIGARTNIQDGCVLHVTHDTHPLVIGDEVTVGHQACLHGCMVGNRCLVGIGARVLDGAILEDECMVAAGALVPPGFRVPAKSLVMGMPAKVVRKLSPEQIADLAASADRYVEYARLTAAGLQQA